MQNPFPQTVKCVGLFAPAGIPEAAALQRGMARFQQWGLRTVLEPTGPSRRFLSAEDDQRAQRLNRLLERPDVDAVMALRGGYGCARMLDYVDWERVAARTIPVIGYSDVTALHMAAFAKGCRTHVCGPMVCSTLGRRSECPAERKILSQCLRSLAAVLKRRTGPCHHAPLQVLREGSAQGPIVPANLAVLASLVGTPYMPVLDGCLLVLEDVNEAAYRVDRCLQQLDAACNLGRLGGLVFGQFTGGEDPQWLPDVFADFAQRCTGPVCAGLPFGHGHPSISLPVGANGTLQADRVAGQLLRL